MPNQQLLDYANQRKAAGATVEIIKGELLKSGWPEIEVNKALGIMPTPAPVPMPAPAPAPAPSAGYGVPTPAAAPVPPPGMNPVYGATPGATPEVASQIQGMANGVAQIVGTQSSPHMQKIIQGITMWNVISGVIYAGANYIAYMFLFNGLAYSSYYRYSYGFGDILGVLIGSLVGGIIGGFIISMWWRPIFNFFHGITGGWLNTPFKLFFYPIAVLMILPSLPALAIVPVYTLISVGGLLVARYLFAINADKIVRTYIG